MLICTSILSGCAAPASSASETRSGCKPLKYLSNYIPVEVDVMDEGSQCLVEDLVQRSAIDVAEGFRQRGQPSTVMTFFHAKNVDLDLQGHLVSVHPFKNATGIAVHESESSLSRLKELPRNLRVRNGVVRSPGPYGVGVYLGFHKKFALAMNLYAPAYEPLPEDQHPMSDQRSWESGKKIGFINPWNYQPPTHFVVEGMRIEAGGRGVIMVGANNVLRNSIIDVDSDTAVYLYGPGAVVEDNTFIVHLDPAHPSTLPAALKLRDADGAVIRNNRFIVKSAAGKQADVAINLLSSKHVVIEQNTYENTLTLVRKDSESTTVESGNSKK
jgi:hypothetical protein